MALSESKKGWLSLENFDVAVIGGSVAGLSLAAEMAKIGYTVCVFEEHQEIGEPEKCDGLVSLNLLRRAGYQPSFNIIQDFVKKGVLHSPSGKELSFDTRNMELVVLDRSQYDKQISKTAEYRGAEVRTNTRVRRIKQESKKVEVLSDSGSITASFAVDASGPSSAPKRGLIPAAKYEIEGEWIEGSSFHVFFDQRLFPCFFGWIISSGKQKAKAGAAGRSINPFLSLERLLSNKKYNIVRKIGSPIYIGGPSYPFVSGRILKVGESAGQVKPTTAGGISLAVLSSVLAARYISEALESSKPEVLVKYQRDWQKLFGREMKLMLSARRFFESLQNKDIERIFSAISERGLQKKVGAVDFDFHVSSLIKSIGIKNMISIARISALSLLVSLFSPD